jgi:hypothetical protein
VAFCHWYVRVLVETADGSWRWIEYLEPLERSVAVARRDAFKAMGYKAESLPCC